MLSREAFIKDRDYVFNKVYGALAGIAIGDSFGDAARMQEETGRITRLQRTLIKEPAGVQTIQNLPY